MASLTDRIRIEFEDNTVIVVDKPAGLLTMATDKERLKTVYAILRAHLNAKREQLFIVHRLDRDTSGVLIVAKTDAAHFALAEQFAERLVEKEYFTVVVGAIDRDRDLIDLPIGIHPFHREKMAIRREGVAA